MLICLSILCCLPPAVWFGNVPLVGTIDAVCYVAIGPMVRLSLRIMTCSKRTTVLAANATIAVPVDILYGLEWFLDNLLVFLLLSSSDRRLGFA